MRVVLLALHLLVFSTSVFSRSEPEMDSILSNYRLYLFRSVNLRVLDSAVAVYVAHYSPAKQWTEVNYNDTSSASWQVMGHLGRVETLAYAWADPASAFYQNASLWAVLSQSLDHWLEKRYQNRNWWHNEIGVPRSMRNILVLTRDHLSSEQFHRAMEVFAQHKVKGTGANMIWSADLGMHFGLLNHDEDLVAKTSQLIAREIKVSTDEGIQPDYSFHQHEARLQTHSYGSSFLSEAVRIAWELRNSKWAFEQEKIRILTDFVLKGWQWMARGIYVVPGTIDRSATRINALTYADLRSLLPYLRELDPQHKPQFDAIAGQQNGTGPFLRGFRYYPYSDFAAYQQNDFSVFVKTISDRTLPSESIISENLKGRLLNNGDTYLVRNGTEYFNLLPVWDWNFLPGITNAGSDLTIVRNSFAGSVTDGRTGATAMVYGLEGAGKTLAAHKFWASDQNLTVCLVAGLTGQNITDSIFTALDQCRWQGPVMTNHRRFDGRQGGRFLLPDTRWIYHAQFAYIPLRPSTIKLELEKRTGTWSAINQSIVAPPVQDSVFLPLLYHSPSEPATGYVLASCTSADAVKSLVAHPTWKVLANTGHCQAVVFQNKNVMAAFYANATLQVDRATWLTVDKPCLVQLVGNSLFVSDPLHKGEVLHMALNQKKYTVTLKADGTTTALTK
ncbi:polysaccharide lyase family 8 super-sandwich domain-containing protein [Flavisolibacter nicotianae]|uniref:polysaccharide lyase family 8 super-sandwich domain-containing protein n=1 Tax=Flavisolibacter nicotianae TaxID=2364882 RepID=UPI000EB028EB|nr:polysaccharide lyase family 8 super-sandwich domain-containing protein [Flavisolibacter nicotianae]